MNAPKRFTLSPLPTGASSRLLLLVVTLAIASAAHAGIIWTGPSLSFTNQSVTNVDQLTPNVWITRGTDGQGIFNAKTETAFTHFFSPSNTAWADGTIANTNVTYSDWNTWAKILHGGPPNTVGLNAVVHLLSEDVYLNVRFTMWPNGGGFVYQRSTPAVGTNNPPRFISTSGVPSTGEFRLMVLGTAGKTYATEISSNLMSWFPLVTNVAATDSFTITDFVSPNILQRFYRLRQND